MDRLSACAAASPSGTSVTSLVLPSGNGARASDFESWFFLVQNSPLQFTANVAAAPQIRAEGLAEVVGDITLTGTGGFPTAAGTARTARQHHRNAEHERDQPPFWSHGPLLAGCRTLDR